MQRPQTKATQVVYKIVRQLMQKQGKVFDRAAL
jgi:hypothetical protein